jgi:hypothetical protein
VHAHETHVCRLKKALYKVKQAPSAWSSRIDEYLLGLGFSKTAADPNFNYLFDTADLVVSVLRVDDLILTRNSKKLIATCKVALAQEFDIMDIGSMQSYLALEVWRGTREVFLGRGKYIVENLKRFHMMDYKPMTTPMMRNLKFHGDLYSDLVDPSMCRQLIGSLIYLVNTRLDICFAVNTLSQFMVEPRQIHWITAKHVLQYLNSIYIMVQNTQEMAS